MTSNVPSSTEVEEFILRQRQATRVGQTIPLMPEGWTLKGAVLQGFDLRDAKFQNAELRDADLRGADLRGARMVEIDLRGANLFGARIDEGVVVSHAAGVDGGYCWHVLRVKDGTIILQYGGERATLDVWRTRGPNYGSRNTLDPEHWGRGPAVAIAAAENEKFAAL